MKKIIVVFLVIAISHFNALAKYYIKDWGFDTCSSTDCYWAWAEIWDDNGTNNTSDERFVGKVERLICGVSISQRIYAPDNYVNDASTLDFHSEYDVITNEYLKNLSVPGHRAIAFYPNQLKSGEQVNIVGTENNDFPLLIQALNVNTSKTYEFRITEPTFLIPSNFEKGNFFIDIKDKDDHSLVKGHIVIE